MQIAFSDRRLEGGLAPIMADLAAQFKQQLVAVAENCSISMLPLHQMRHGNPAQNIPATAFELLDFDVSKPQQTLAYSSFVH